MRMPPGWDGLETIVHLWQAQPSLQAIICTAYSDYSWEDINRCLNQSDRFLILKKPFDNVEVHQLASALTSRARVERELAESNGRLVETSRHAGMAEVATGVLHNVGNVLNSVNVSASLVQDRFRQSKIASLVKTAALLREHEADLGPYLTTDPKGQRLPGFLLKLADHLAAEQQEILGELASLTKNIEHIKEIVAMQQTYARVSGVNEHLPPETLVEDAIRINESALTRHRVQLARQFEPVPDVVVDKHKVLQILINLIRNAKYAIDAGPNPDKALTLRIRQSAPDRVQIQVQDSGVGIPPENLTRIFGHGFTTKKDGHGFGLHSGANAAREMGGSLSAHSDGPGQGATFTLELPVAPIRPQALCPTTSAKTDVSW